MAKRKIQQLFKEGPEEIRLDSGVTVKVRPFPAGLYEKIQSWALTEHPDISPPQRTINVLDGTEMVDDLENPAYLAAQAAVKKKRDSILGEAVYDLCVEVVDMPRWEAMIRRLEKYQAPFPKEPDERRLEFLTSFAMTTAADYQRVMSSAIGQTLIQDPEVVDRLNSFRGDLEGSVAPDLNASGVDGRQRLEVRPEAS